MSLSADNIVVLSLILLVILGLFLLHRAGKSKSNTQ